MKQKNNEVQEVLEIGNHDSLLLFGNDIQRELGEVSKMLASMAMNNDVNVEKLTQNIICKIDDFQVQLEVRKKKSIPWLRNVRKEKIKKRYSEIIVDIDKVELVLKLQEAKLIKDSKILEELENKTEDTIQKIDQIVSYGENVFLQKQDEKLRDDELEEWYIRLRKKLDDLKISYTLAIQSNAQILLMLQNDRQLIDKIISMLSGTIPIWRNQVSLLLGIQKSNQDKEIQEHVFKDVENQVRLEISYEMLSDEKEIGVGKLLQSNETLKKSLNELLKIESNDLNTRKEIVDHCF